MIYDILAFSVKCYLMGFHEGGKWTETSCTCTETKDYVDVVNDMLTVLELWDLAKMKGVEWSEETIYAIAEIASQGVPVKSHTPDWRGVQYRPNYEQVTEAIAKHVGISR